MATILHNLANGDYHASSAVGSSGLKLLKRSPLHYWSAYLDPERPPQDPSPAMLRGTAWHAAVFEPEKFAAEFAASPGLSGASTLGKLFDTLMADPAAFDRVHVCIPAGLGKASKEGRALHADLASEGKVGVDEDHWNWLQDNRAALVGRSLLPAATLDDVVRMAAASRAHPAVRVLFSQPRTCRETSLFWTDPLTGVACKIRPDFHVEPPNSLFPHGAIVDGKSCQDASPQAFARDVWDLEMHIQAAFYSDGFMEVYDTAEPPAFMWLAQEAQRPYANRLYTCGADLIEHGRREYRSLLKLLARCQSTDEWPGYSTAVQSLELPAWAAKAVADAAA